jgi:membrane-bound metal-dependent hydrolase YbcI (DUF457 family)
MEKVTHIIMAFLVFLLFGFVLNFPIYMSLYAFVGVLIPDIDTKTKRYHRKLLHNIWTLIIILFAGFSLGLLDRGGATVFSLGFLSHLIGDSITHQGIMPLWPIKRPKFNGPIRTGGIGEYLVLLILLVMIYWIGTAI